MIFLRKWQKTTCFGQKGQKSKKFGQPTTVNAKIAWKSLWDMSRMGFLIFFEGLDFENFDQKSQFLPKNHFFGTFSSKFSKLRPKSKNEKTHPNILLPWTRE